MTGDEKAVLRELVDTLKKQNGSSKTTVPDKWTIIIDLVRNVGVPAIVLVLIIYFGLPPMVKTFTNLVDKTAESQKDMTDHLEKNSELLKEAKDMMKDVPYQREQNHQEHMEHLRALSENVVGKETAILLEKFKDVPIAHEAAREAHEKLLENQEKIIEKLD